jgi:5-methylcytosine-specific restriction endonuclease McrA
MNYKGREKEYQKEYHKNRYENDKEYRDKIIEQSKKFGINNKEKRRLASIKYRIKYPEKAKEYNDKYYSENRRREINRCKRKNAVRKGAEGSHTLGEWELLKDQYGHRCPCCGKSEPFNQYHKLLTEDHIIPLIKGGSDYIENIQPLCSKCNNIKYTKIIKYNCLSGITTIAQS